MKKLSNTEVELKKSVAYKKERVFCDTEIWKKLKNGNFFIKFLSKDILKLENIKNGEVEILA